MANEVDMSSRSRNRLAHQIRLSAGIVAAVIAIIALSLTVPAQASGSTRQSGTPAPKGPVTAVTPPPLTLQDLVQNLGAKTYQDTYGGMTVSPATQETAPPSHITVYVVATAPDAAQFLTAIHNAAVTPGGSSTSYSIVDVTHSWTQLNALTLQIAQQHTALLARGINMAMVGPDPSTNKVAISVTSSTPAAAQILSAIYGTGWTSVSAMPADMIMHLTGQAAASPRAASINQGINQGRFQDSDPFFGGDFINNPTADQPPACTDGFVMLGAIHPQNHWLMTAGHCGTQSTWFTNLTNFYILGATSTNYFPSTVFDVQTIGLASPFRAFGDVWGDNYTTYQPYTTLTPGAGQLITFDGALTGEVHGIKVTKAGPFCYIISNLYYCGLGEAGSTNGPVLCADGDSGGPVFQRTPTQGPVQAIGLITLSNSAGNVCDYTLLNSVMGTTETQLDTNPGG
jgi:hypothetical protein